MNRLWNPVLVCVLCLGAITQFAPPVMAQANATGQWQTLPYTMPINPIHVTLLNTGNVLVVSGSGNDPGNPNLQAAVWNPLAGTVTVQTVGFDMFCNGMITLPDGRVLIAGGTIAYTPAFLGSSQASIYDPVNNTFTNQPAMAHGRWYPSVTTLPNGSVMVFSGLTETGPTNSTYEFYTLGSGWSPAYAAPWTPPLYPRMHVLPNGNLFYSGLGPSSNLFNPSTNTWTLNVATTNYDAMRLYGSSVLLPLTPGNNYDPRVMILGGGTTTTPATATTEIIDLGAANPKWVYGPNMSAPRIEMDATILPNGKVLALGGSVNDENAATASLNADLYDPNANTFSPAGTEAFARLYHTVSLLMPDATVWVAGGNPNQGNYEPHMEVYSPPYLFNADGSLATRPTITSLSTSKLGWGGAFTVQTPDAANISSVVLMRDGSSTHAFDFDQRYVGLSFTSGSGVLNVTAPPNANIAPPGYYMLFILNSSGVPSVASFVQFSANPTAQSPTGKITSPASNVMVAAGKSVSFAASGTDPNPGGTISSYYWSFYGGNPSSSTLANPVVTYPTPGTYSAQLTVTDNLGLTDPHPPTLTITVPDFSLAVSPNSNAVTPGSATTSTITVTAGGGFTGNVNLSASGLPPGATAAFSPTAVTNSGSSTMTISTSALVALGAYSVAVTASNGPITHTATFLLEVISPGGTPAINLASGFSAAGMQLNGNAHLVGTRLQLTDTTTINEDGSAFWTAPVSIGSFTTNFAFQLTNPQANGFMFVIQNVGTTALGANAGGLGFAGLYPSVGVKFDLYNEAGEGPNTTGLFTSGDSPTVPATTFGGGINLLSGDLFYVNMVYNGTTLTMTIMDLTVPASFTTSWPINIPATVLGNTAYVGFTGSTGGLTALQQILTWTFNSGTTASPAATPVINPATGTYTSAQTVTITDGTAGSTIYFTTDGTTPTTSSTKYTGTFNVSKTTTVNAIATAPNSTTSAMATSVITIQTSGTTPINFSSGFSAAGIQLNGNSKLVGTRLQLTDTTTTFEDGSAFWSTPVNVGMFTTDFTFQLTNPVANGFMFVIQNVGATALGANAGGLGFAGLYPSVGVKFDLYDQGEGPNTTGLFVSGDSPTVPATTFGGGINLLSGDVLEAHFVYDGATLTLTVTDLTVPGTFTTSWPINIPATVLGNTAYVGFTGSTGGGTALQQFLAWTYYVPSASQTATPAITPATGTYPAAQTVTITDGTAGSTIYYTINGTTPTTASTKYTAPFKVTKTTTVNAIATAPNLANSAVATSVITIQVPVVATPVIKPATGTYTGTQTVSITDSTAGSTIHYTTNGNTPTTSSTIYKGTFRVSTTKTIHAIAVAPNYANSAIATSVITIN
ncbi:MAG TPA: chitobiase/beta-hexosaminidase C-terminal domain-containing protein [Verrucomicrobiae bacterium]|nr:chitobiase/beta-hexosaminidase C-terminal domain-containing protein [Verrucomicrobiae bacterium]